MLRAGVNDKDGPVVLCGLSEGNVERLRAGYPIKADFSTFGVDLAGKLVIIYGKAEADIAAMLKKGGLVALGSPETTDARLEEEAAIRAAYPKILICTVGLPRSGKTTWARRLSFPIVNPDSIRLAIHGQRFIGLAEGFVWATAKAMVRALFLAGHHTVILDATNTTRKRREEWASPDWGSFFKEIETPREECERRAKEEGDKEILPVIERMASAYEPIEAPERRWP